ncbi:hypothetical protein [Cupriavidus pauculus]|uniref:hypothetical protein n=1 Tax=Cupriavidus pauculus TaxID=82633 RepID=UPI0038576D11
MDDTKIVEALAALTAGSAKRTKMGVLRALLPLIESAQAAGVPHDGIWQTLKEHGLDVSFKTYSVMLARARAQMRVAPPGAIALPESSTRQMPPAKVLPGDLPEKDFQAAPSDPYGVIPDKDAVTKKFDRYQSSNPLLKRTKSGEK